MKRNLIALALVLFFGNVLFASAQAPDVDTRPISSRLVVSEYGTLLDVLNADGSRRFDTLTLDGFEVNYKFKSQWKKVQAIGATAGEGLRSGQINVEGNSTTVTVTTDDDALEITNRFTLNRQNELVIRRTIRNISNEKLNLDTTKQFLDPKLIGTRCSTDPTSLKKAANRQVTAFGCEDNCPALNRPPHDPPCLTYVCMLRSFGYRPFLATPEPTQRIGDCKGITFEWGRPKVFAPTSREVSGNEVKEMHFNWGVRLPER